MDPLASLESEAAVLLEVADALERYATSLDMHLKLEDESEVKRSVEEITTFFFEYVELFHNEKEESLLIPALVTAGCNYTSEMIRVSQECKLRLESLQRVVDWAATQKDRWSWLMINRLRDTLLELVVVQRQSVENARNFLYPSVRSSLPPPELVELGKRINGYDAEEAPTPLASSASKLISRLSLPPGAVASN